MIDNNTVVIYGWQIKGYDEVNKFIEELEKIDQDYIDKFESIIIDDTMSGNYLYFGAILAHYDSENDPDPVIINSELIEKATSKYNKIVEENPELKELFKKYKKTSAQLIVFQHIW